MNVDINAISNKFFKIAACGMLAEIMLFAYAGSTIPENMPISTNVIPNNSVAQQMPTITINSNQDTTITLNSIYLNRDIINSKR